MTIGIPLCASCKRFNHDDTKRVSCEAYPKGVPSEIILWRHDHRRPYPGDGGLLYEHDPKSPFAEPAPTKPRADRGDWP